MQPRIGIQAQIDTDTDEEIIRTGYFGLIEQAGGIPDLFSPARTAEEADAIVARFDGILIPGGDDINPARYGEEPLPCTGKPVVTRDIGEPLLLAAIVQADIPFLGICRGCQTAHVFFGGKLYQDITNQHPGDVVHWQDEHDFTPSHEVIIDASSPLGAAIAENHLAGPYLVNSYHHQAIKPPLPAELREMAHATDGIIEALYRPASRFFWGVQWHPELVLDNPLSRIIAANLLSAAEAYRKEQ